MTDNYTVLSLIDLSNELEDQYTNTENNWLTCKNENEKKISTANILRWCKNNRDLFDGIEPYSSYVINSIIEHETRWVDRTIVWRSRFNEYYMANMNNDNN